MIHYGRPLLWFHYYIDRIFRAFMIHYIQKNLSTLINNDSVITEFLSFVNADTFKKYDPQQMQMASPLVCELWLFAAATAGKICSKQFSTMFSWRNSWDSLSPALTYSAKLSRWFSRIPDPAGIREYQVSSDDEMQITTYHGLSCRDGELRWNNPMLYNQINWPRPAAAASCHAIPNSTCKCRCFYSDIGRSKIIDLRSWS
jgi:hypothetical protein